MLDRRSFVFIVIIYLLNWIFYMCICLYAVTSYRLPNTLGTVAFITIYRVLILVVLYQRF